MDYQKLTNEELQEIASKWFAREGQPGACSDASAAFDELMRRLSAPTGDVGELVARIRPILEAYAVANPIHNYHGEPQDPRGVHALLARVKELEGLSTPTFAGLNAPPSHGGKVHGDDDGKYAILPDDWPEGMDITITPLALTPKDAKGGGA